ncbi:TetR-like C-terminal domain-containing protein [Nocardioides sp. zg-1228]|uniref:TetR-like C-terminal domain-containing protein n=1 Tax=Nocardioides sp. zg-1228 TaxID=2763008 RepID=UPI001642E84B|nr:TetR-like C-terminal domain-containing protein [Nocardioides sp. zg-1228]MBC2934398.1 TetR/AcrR family transcriptional regulator C-terminal ligand-binding domain-containing protein [Nocardioides sp. zg-1228]QSF59167.1 TetR/AcrR family transcriptional regulator C-terminal ligand-binding domain-containing protein [Nocardioides sp. zg-1228]
MSVEKQARNQGGRPRDSRVDEAVACAVRELLTEVGYTRLTVTEVAARAAVGKAAIYRRHATKQEMIFDVLMPNRFLAAAPDRGSLRADLAAVLAEIADSMATPPPGTIPGLLADIHADPALQDRFDAKYLGAQRQTLAEVLDRATARGELTTRPDLATLNALLVGPVFAWLFLLSESPDQLPALTCALLDATLALISAQTLPQNGQDLTERAGPVGRAHQVASGRVPA